jgi:uncharacterized protein (TIGR03085 family)
MTTTVARREREALCDLFDDVGPDAPTLCGDWTTRDLAAHLVVRERNLLGGVGIVAAPFARFTDKGMEREELRPWPELVERVRSGPMWFGRPVDALINTFEYFIHHEDVRRGDGNGEPRTGIDEVEDELWRRLRASARLLTRKLPKGVGLEVVRPGDEPVSLRAGDRTARLVGSPGEVTLYLYGRKGVARVELEGDDEAIGAVRKTDFGV